MPIYLIAQQDFTHTYHIKIAGRLAKVKAYRVTGQRFSLDSSDIARALVEQDLAKYHTNNLRKFSHLI